MTNQAHTPIVVKSHVGRDLLQSASLFKTDKLVVWEYVSNGLQYIEPGTNPLVRVVIEAKSKKITITDNGRGMDWTGLQNYFIMHAENIDRAAGKGGRGRFGTGKSAAFGIADILRITTVHRGRRASVELSRSDIVAMKSGEPVPVRVLERDEPTDEPNGTRIEIEQIHLKLLDQAGIIRYVERHLARWPKNARVIVNNHECEVAEPEVARELRFRPEQRQREILGDVELMIKVATAPLDEELRGVSIYANGVWYETTLAGNKEREMAQYIFGEIDVPQLDEDRSPIAPFDLSRSMQLNPSNDLVRAIYAFVGQKIDEVRRDLVAEDKRRRAGEEARKLAKEASQIAEIINQDFNAFRQRLKQTKAKVSGGSDLYHDSAAGTNDDDLIYGGEEPADVVSETGGPGASGGRGGNGTEPRRLNPEVEPGTSASPKQGRRASSSDSVEKPGGGFGVKFDNMGAGEHRAKYVPGERTIYINLDHPQLTAARGSDGTEDLLFRRLSYEVAFSEYAVALASELAGRGEYLDPSDPIVDIRETLDRVVRAGARLYSK